MHKQPQSQIFRYAFGYSDEKPHWSFWAIIVAMVAYVLASAITISPAASAPSCMSRQACIDSDNGYCRYTPTDNGRCWSTDRAFLKKVKAGKAGHSVKRKPLKRSEPKSPSEPHHQTETTVPSEPLTQREPKFRSEPPFNSEPKNTSEPFFVMETSTQSEPLALTEPKIVSEPGTRREPYPRSDPRSTREPKSSSLDIALIGVFTFASAFMGFNAARILQENPIYWGFPRLPPPPLDLANSPYRTMPAPPLELSPVLIEMGRFVGEAQRRVH